MGILDYLILTAVFLWLTAVVYKFIKDKKQGKTSCCGSSGCKNCHGGCLK